MSSEPEIDLGGAFSVRLEFMAERCPKCGEPREPGPCPQCGVEVGASEEVAVAAQARARALEAIDQELQELIERFGQLPEGSIVVSNDQFATALGDAEIFARIAEMTRIGAELEALDVNDRSVIGGELRAKMLTRVGRVRELLGACEELALFDPKGPAAELRSLAAQSGRYGAELTEAFIKVLVAEAIPAARSAEAQMQELISGFSFADRLSELLREMEAWLVPDFDARAELVLGRPGNYSDEYGFLDLGAVFRSFADEEKPYEALAACGRRYFSHLIGSGPVQDEARECFLVVPAIGLATLDRPLVAHRICRSTFELLGEAHAAAPVEVQRVVDRTVGEAQLILVAIEQIRRGVVLLAAGEAAGVADEEAILKTVMEAYRDLSETSFRTYGRLILDLERLKQGKQASETPDPPPLGNLTQALAASAEPAAKALADSCDRALRNACGHAQYRWDRQTEEVVDMRTDQRWSIEELDSSVAAISAAITGADAGYTCFLIGDRAEIKVPDWASDGAGAVAGVVARATFGARGFEVIEVRDAGLSVVIDDGGELDKLGMMSSLGGMTALASPDQAVRVLGDSGRLLLDVEVAAFRAASEAKDGFRDLAILIPYFSNSLRVEGDQDKALLDWTAVMVNQVVTSAPVEFNPPAMLSMGDRFGYVIDFATERSEGEDEELSLLLKRAKRCRGFTYAAARGDEEAAPKLAQEILVLSQWLGETGIVWPPRF